MSNLRNQIAEQTNNVQEIAEELAERIKNVLQPAPPPKRAVKIGTSVAAFALLIFIARFIYELYQVPGYEADVAVPTDG